MVGAVIVDSLADDRIDPHSASAIVPPKCVQVQLRDRKNLVRDGR